ncbi:MAG: heparinase II/III family protein [Sedimentisphaerales bacterium]|nr:heparinase II/III family protein [Sedimentisphaerales bacterium]
MERPVELCKTIADKAVHGIWSIQPVGGDVCWPDVQVPLEVLWKGTAVENESWKFALHSLFILHDLVVAHQEAGSRDCLETGRKIITSWIKCNPRLVAPNPFSWGDHSTAVRAVSICAFLDYYVANTPDRASIRRFEEIAAGSLSAHARYLAYGMDYVFPHNHGMFQDYALIVTASHLAAGKASDRWVHMGLQRFERQVARTFSPEGIHLENSPGYHVAITGLLRRTVAYCDHIGLDVPESLRETLARAESAIGSFVMPDGDIVPVGDTPRHLRVKPAGQTNLRTFQVWPTAGYAVMNGDWWVFLAASNNSSTHKHCDDLSLIIHDGAGMVLSDAGFLNYEPLDPRRDFTRSWLAHNTMTSATEGLLDRSEQCGIHAFGDGDGCYFLRGRSFRKNGAVHQRSVLYDQKARIVLIIDRCEAPEEMEWWRVFQLDPRISIHDETELKQRVVLRTMQGVDLELSFGAGDVAREVVIGGRTPLCGWVAQPLGELLPAAATIERIRGKKVTLVAALSPLGSVVNMGMESDDVCVLESAGNRIAICEMPSSVAIETQPVGEHNPLSVPARQAIALHSVESARPFGRLRYAEPFNARARVVVLGVTLLGWVVLIQSLRSRMLANSRYGLCIVLACALLNAVVLWAIWARLVWSLPVEQMF